MNSFSVFDTCTLINLMHIDEDEFLFGIIKNMEFVIAEEVYKELEKNIFKKYDYFDKKKIYYDKDKKERIKELLTFFRGKYIRNEDVKNDLADGFNEISEFCNIREKQNGELYSCALSLIRSRVNSCKITMYTDDFPAKEAFSKYFKFQQIGQILDTSDLLIYFYWRTEKFKLNQLKLLLSSLASEYSFEVSQLKKNLESYKTSLHLDDRRDNEFMSKLQIILNGLSSFNSNEILIGYEYFKRKKKCSSKEITRMIDEHLNVLSLTNRNNENIITKIQSILKTLNNYDIFKVA